jgi:hypothetical protein
MTGSLIGLNLNMTYGNFSKGMIVLGNVGIGKTSPNYKLDVLGSINATNINATGIIQATTFIGSGSSLTGISSTTPPWNSSGANVFLNDSTANVGIGTASPTQTLTVIGTANVTGNISLGTNVLFVDNTSGRVGIGTLNPTHELHVVGDANITGTVKANNLTVGNVTDAYVPAGAVMFFSLGSCPSGWSEFTSVRGRYIVGLPSGGTLAGTVGTALSDQENRAVGKHNHSIIDPAHEHTLPTRSIGDGSLASSMPQGSSESSGSIANDPINSATTDVTINDTGSVAGTNAPYIQLLSCQKD